jgi:hypothetical protein
LHDAYRTFLSGNLLTQVPWLQVAAIVAECMHNYLLFGSVLQCSVVDPEKVHPDTFKNANRKFVKVSATLGALNFTYSALAAALFNLCKDTVYFPRYHMGETPLLAPALATVGCQQVLAVPVVWCNQWLVGKKTPLALLSTTNMAARSLILAGLTVFVNKTGHQPKSFRSVFARMRSQRMSSGLAFLFAREPVRLEKNLIWLWPLQVPWQRIAREQHNKDRTPEEQERVLTRLLKADEARRKRLREQGIEYDFEGFQAAMPAKGKKTKLE